MSLCVLGGVAGFRLVAALFTLSWTHSVQKTRWEEDWRVEPYGLRLVEARVQGSGAGMEAGEGAVREGGWWRWRPELPAQSEVILAISDAVPEGWRLCAGAECRALTPAAFPGAGTVRLAPCP